MTVPHDVLLCSFHEVELGSGASTSRDSMTEQLRRAVMHESCQRAFRLFRHPPGIVRISTALPPHLTKSRPGARFERFLDHPVTGIGAAATGAAVTEVRLPVFLFE